MFKMKEEHHRIKKNLTPLDYTNHFFEETFHILKEQLRPQETDSVTANANRALLNQRH